MQRVLHRLVAFCLLATLCLGACDSGPEKQPLRFGLSDWPGHAPFYAAAKLGFYDPVRVEIKGFSSNFDRNRAFAQGRLDLLATPLFDALRIADEGVPLKIVLLFDYSSGGDGIVARKEIAGMADLKGKKVSAELGAITHFVLLSALTRAGLAESDVGIVNLSVPEGAAAFEQGKVDAATLWDPHLSKLAGGQGAHKIFTSKEIPGQVIDVLIVQKDIAEKRPDAVKSVIEGWERALTAWKERPRDLEATMAREMNRTPESLQADFTGLELLDVATNKQLFEKAHEQSVWKSYAATTDFMARHNLLKRAPVDGGEILDPRFLELAGAK